MMIDDDWISDSQTSIHQKITQNPLNPFTDDFPEKNLHFETGTSCRFARHGAIWTRWRCRRNILSAGGNVGGARTDAFQRSFPLLQYCFIR